MRSSFDEMYAAFRLQTDNNRGLPPDLTPVFAQHGWTGPEFYAQLNELLSAQRVDITAARPLTAEELKDLAGGY